MFLDDYPKEFLDKSKIDPKNYKVLEELHKKLESINSKILYIPAKTGLPKVYENILKLNNSKKEIPSDWPNVDFIKDLLNECLIYTSNALMTDDLSPENLESLVTNFENAIKID